MKLTIPRDALVPALAAATRVVDRRNTIPVLSNVLIEAADDGAVTLTATDLDMEIRVRLAARVGEAGRTTIHAGRLHYIVGKLQAGADIEMETTADDTSAMLRSGRSRFTLSTLHPDDFPAFATGDWAAGFDIPAETLAEAIETTTFAISTDETRYYLNGVHMHAVGGALGATLVAVATDGHRLSKWARPAPVGAEAMPGIIVPRKTAAEIGRLCKGASDQARVEVSTEKIRLTLGDTHLTSRLIDGTFPDYVRVVPATSSFVVSFDREALAASADRVMVVQTGKGSAVKCAFRDGVATISATNPDVGSATEEMAFDDEGGEDGRSADVEIGLNGRYLRDALSSFAGDRVTVGLTDPGTPAVLRPWNPAATAAERLVVIMPMRV